MNELQKSISKCTVKGNIVYLPSEILQNYKDVRKALINSGGTYKRNTFVFKTDAQPYIDRLINGDSVNIKKEFQFYETPPEISAYMVQLANITANSVILEPSAGSGNIIKEIHKTLPSHPVYAYELMPENINILNNMENVILLGDDFMKAERENNFSTIIANPPFNKNQDIDHIRLMYELLEQGGTLISLCSQHYLFAQGRKETIFREFILNTETIVEELEAGTFKESGTNIKTILIKTIKK